ncbi:uncharacterized protein ACA1_093890 [Acanthamoeba castellanii str. Neff]|uniref:Leucine rich repeat domain containing protein n=1 Tax=Acanthamoeba castellanii (strain ATCC 30010 / Neff) TaxID=1257118 RepID=L8GIL9_ACACF|nr:uncharacterized protein ACA1_093890 [Acanthamoeba castellanii str. Neff]ELR12842.1 hypothetical protein ACA1_093890 [Acanthamoeba castellanii str. Neff]
MSSTNAERKKSGSAYSAKKKASSSDRKETFALAGASGLSTSASSLAYSPTASPSPPSYGSGYGSSGGTGGEYRYSDDSDENNLGNQTSLFTKMVYRDIETLKTAFRQLEDTYMLDMRASVNEWQANKNQEARVAELEREVATLRERVVDGDNYSYALQKLNARIRDAVEEGQARFEDNLRHLQTTENQLLEANKDGRDVLEEKYRLSNEKVLLLSEKADSTERVLREIMQQVAKASSTPSTTGNSLLQFTLSSKTTSSTLNSSSAMSKSGLHDPLPFRSPLLSDEDAAERQADRDLEKVVKGIKHNTIRSVSFRGTHAKSKQFKAVADAMRVNTTIVAMDLSHVKIPNPSVSALCESFAVHKTLSTLKCKNSSLTFECCVSIATYLASSSTLRTLSLAANAIDESAADALGEALRENKSLTSLNLSFAELGPKGVAPLAAGLAQHPALTQLNLSRNAITSHGIKEIGIAYNLRMS